MSLFCVLNLVYKARDEREVSRLQATGKTEITFEQECVNLTDNQSGLFVSCTALETLILRTGSVGRDKSLTS